MKIPTPHRTLFTTLNRNILLLGAAVAILNTLIACANLVYDGQVEGDEFNPPKGVNSPQQGRVVSVIDGASIEVIIDAQIHRVRYIGVNIPESERGGAFQFNQFMVSGKTVQLERDSIEADSNGALLRYVYVNGEMINEALIDAGYALVASNPSGFAKQSAFLLAEQNAKSNQRGVWSEPSVEQPTQSTTPTPPPVQPTPTFSGGTLPLPR